MIHELKCATEYFKEVIAGKKSFEVRKNDRPYMVGDMLALNEYDTKEIAYTGASCVVYVDYILKGSDYCKDGYIIMSVKPCGVYIHNSPYSQISMKSDYSVPLATERRGKKSSRT